MKRRITAKERQARAARRRRERWAQRYRPREIDLLLLAEGPPAALDRYFYFPDVPSHDSLFREVAAELVGGPRTRLDKGEQLNALKERGVFLIDAVQMPVADELAVNIPRLASRIRRLQPRRIVIVKAPVFDRVYLPLEERGLPVINVRIPFPGSGQQARFREAFRRALRRRPPAPK
jgi:hypothetical protein